MGWDEKYFTSRWNLEWTALVNQPRELTPRIWKIIRPKLEAILEASKAAELKMARQARLLQRRSELIPIWSKFVGGMPDTQERWLMPNLVDAGSLPTIADMLMEDDTPLTEERFFARVDPILSDVGHFQRTVKRDLVKLLTPKKNPPKTTSRTADNVEGDVDLTVLDNASSLFYCPTWNCGQLFGFPAIFAHSHVKGASLAWDALKHLIKHAGEAGSIVLQVLKIFGLAKDTHSASLNELDGRCVCLCGHPKFRAPMDFIPLVRPDLYSF
ncbi:hypothetical protein PILCRDRAFT_757017 [Piloderma croceum F 1598]|uniref:Uncharacterized protein n=1 Tax=Piloderma croceum (strain F 1598) TaxID=765440 RepID=A0A0C3EF83_PILCF|nr:hypothetical protein PILCRDRAFT_757017 [Piloderma croceum F 1598]